MDIEKIEKIRKALNIALREHNELMIKADLPVGSKVIEEALDELELYKYEATK